MRCNQIPLIEIFRLKTHEGYSCKLIWNKIYSHQLKTRSPIINCLPSLEKMTMMLFHFILISYSIVLGLGYFSYHQSRQPQPPRPHQRSPQSQLQRFHPNPQNPIYLLLRGFCFIIFLYFVCMKKVNWVCNSPNSSSTLYSHGSYFLKLFRLLIFVWRGTDLILIARKYA